MTTKEMSQLYYLNKEIVQLKKQQEQLEQRLDNMACTSACVQGSAKSFPYVLHNITVEGIANNDMAKWLKSKADLEDIKELLSLKCQQLTYEYNRLNRYIQECEDSLTRQVLSLRYINGLTWVQVAHSVGGGNTEESLRQLCSRYLRKS